MSQSTRFVPPWHPALMMLLPFVVQACGGGSPVVDGGDGGGDNLIALTLSATSAIVDQGHSTSTTVTRGGTFSGQVTLSVTGAPSGVTAAITNPNVSGGSTTSVNITVSSSTPAGDYLLLVRGTGTGALEASVAFTLTVSATASDYTIALAPGSLSIAQGGTGSATATLTRANGFLGPVNLALVPGPNAPSGINATFTPNNMTGNTSAIVVSVESSVATGIYTFFVRGTSSGQTDQTKPLIVTVRAAALRLGVAIPPQ